MAAQVFQPARWVIRRLCLAVALIVLAAGCARRTARMSDDHATAMSDSVRAALEEFRRYSAAGQWDSMVATYAENPRFRWIENGEIRYRSPADVRRALSGMPAGTRLETSYEATEITPLAPGVASVLTFFRTRIGDSAATGGVSFGGAMTMILVHEDRGWRILGGHTSSAVARDP